MNTQLSVIGSNTYVDVVGLAEHVPAKIDTGADSSSVWASNIYVSPDGLLHFKLFDVGSPYYSGKEYTTRDYTVAGVKSSSGHREIRYRASLSLRIGGKKIRSRVNLSDRSTHTFPMLIGRRTLKNKFLVDVSQEVVKIKRPLTDGLNQELAKDPYQFYKRYHQMKDEA